ncbi:MAG TPA: response regulator [Stellaceae bacterium]|jgi:CheY-like chemotaxis protein|nr:response regulator [Stellaceae bacterium]
MYPESHEILVIDDDDARREAIAATLREEGFPVTAVAEGLAGLRAVCRQGFALAISAMRLPGTLDGVATMRQARAKRPDLKFLLVADYPHLPLWLSREPAEVIAAPFHRWELIGCVFELLERDTRNDMLDLSRRARTERWAC